MVFLLVLLKSAEANERSAVTPQEFELAFPKVMDWIQKTLLAHQRLARPVTAKNFQRLPLYFSRAQIEAAQFVVVERIPVPPLSSIGLSRFAEFERGDFGGIPLYLDNPKIGRVYDAEVIGDRIAEDRPVFRHLLA